MKIKIPPPAATTTSGVRTDKPSLFNLNFSTNKPKPTPDSSAKTNITLLDEAPKVMRRPLQLMDGRAYAAVWPYVQIEQFESVDDKGMVTKLTQPKIVKGRHLAIIREDGKVFYHGQPEFNELGFRVDLPERPREEKLLSQVGIQRYLSGERVDPAILFKQLCELTNTFMDFGQSIGTQEEMCELVACFILTTPFVEAFNVVPFLWINGDKGSGKTQLLTLISMVSFLGQMMLSSGSFASLRDHADNGACLCFDEAENLSGPKADPQKREIFLAGNKRGSTVTLKKQGKDNKWENQYVNMFCPRVFSAIEKPDPTLSSRSIIIPMVRTRDKSKGSADIWEFDHWPHEQKRLVDDLWLVALASLADMPARDSNIKGLTPLTGRDLEPWRAILALAYWLESKGIGGLGGRMNRLSVEYQQQRKAVETEDLNALIIRAICRVMGCEVSELCEGCEGSPKSVFMRTGNIELHALLIQGEMELDIDPSEITSQKIGRKLSQQRFDKGREGGTGRYGWMVDRQRLYEWGLAMGLIPQSESG
jgi:hypothetical protein